MVEWLSERPLEETMWFLPQLIQTLRFEPDDCCALIEHLLDCSVRSLKFRVKFYWLVLLDEWLRIWGFELVKLGMMMADKGSLILPVLAVIGLCFFASFLIVIRDAFLREILDAFTLPDNSRLMHTRLPS